MPARSEYHDFPTVWAELQTSKPTETPVWVDVSHLFKSSSVKRGRSEELERTQTGTLRLRLDASDRRFDATYRGELANYVTNPSGETGSTGWQTYGSNTLVRSREHSRFGAWSFKATYQSDLRLASWATLAAGSDATTDFSVWVWIPANWNGGGIYVGEDGTFAGAAYVEGGAPADMTKRDQWQRIYVREFLSNDNSGILIIRAIDPPTAGRFIYVDGAQVEQRPNLAPNPGLDTTTSPWVGFGAALSIDTVEKHDGPGAMKVSFSGSHVGARLPLIPVDPSTTYRFGGWMLFNGGAIRSIWVDQIGENGQVVASQIKTLPHSGGWLFDYVQLTTHPLARGVYCYVLYDGPVGSGGASRVGFNYQAGSFSDTVNSNVYADLTSIGAPSLRVDLWANVLNPSYDGSTFLWTAEGGSVNDRIVAGAVAAGVDLHVILNSNNITAGGHSDADLAAIATAVVNRWSSVKSIEIYNEPQIAFGNRACSAARYSSMLTAVSNAVKAARPSVTVVGFSAMNAAEAFFGTVLSTATYPNVDKWAVHPYMDPRKEGINGPTHNWSFYGKTKGVYDQAAAAGQAKPVWITEFGSSQTVACTDPYWCTPGNTDVTEAEQNAFLVDALTRAFGTAAGQFGSFVERFFVYSYRDNGPSTSSLEENFGIRQYNATDPSLGAAKAARAGIQSWIAANPGGSGVFYLDDVFLERGGSGPPNDYVDGTVDNCRWSGTPHASTSYRGGPYYPNVKPFRRMRISLGENNVPNPNFDLDAANWFANPGGAWSRVANGAEGPPKFGNAHGKLTVLHQASNANSFCDFTIPEMATEGVVFTGSVYLRGFGATVGKTITVQLYESGGASGEFPSSMPDAPLGTFAWATAVLTLTTDWQRVIVTGRFEKNDRAQARLYILPGPSSYADGDWLHVAGAQIALGGPQAFTRGKKARMTAYIEEFPEDWQHRGVGYVDLDGVDAFASLAEADVYDPASWPAEQSGARANRILDNIAWPGNGTLPGSRDIDTGLSTVQGKTYDEPTDALPELLLLQETELGFLFVNASGAIVFKDRHHRLKNRSIVKTIFEQRAPFGPPVVAARSVSAPPYAGSVPYKNVKFAEAGAHIRNDVAIDRPGGTLQRVLSETSRQEFNRRTLSRQPLLTSDSDAADMASYLLSRYENPEYRPARLLLDLRMDANLLVEALEHELDDRIRVTFDPLGDGLQMVDKEAYIESISETIERNSIRFEYELSPADVADYWILDSAANSVLGVSTRLAY